MAECRRGLSQYKPLKPQTLNRYVANAVGEPVRREQEEEGIQ